MKTWIIGVAGAIGGGIAYLFGGWDTSILVLLLCMLIDYVSGLVVAGIFHKSKKTQSGALESKTCWKGLIRKGMTMAILHKY